MYKILRKQDMGNQVYEYVVEAPRVAKKAQAGQFIIVRQGQGYERIPLTIADFDREAGTITMIFQAVGASTRAMALLEEGEGFADVAGPLGHATEVEKYGTVVMVGGGIGIAPIYPIARALKEAGNEVISIIGARNKDLLFWEEKMAAVSDQLLVATDDGSAGRQGFVTQVLEDVIKEKTVNQIWAIGPMVMMRAVAKTTLPYGIKTIVSMNPIMVDGTGMCGACRVSVGHETKFACVDGPEFDAHAIDFDLAMKRASVFKEEEALASAALEARIKGGQCQCQSKG